MAGVVITRVSETKKGRMALFCEEGFLFSLDDETYHRRPVEEGETLAPEELEALRLSSDTRKAKDKALTYLSTRSYGSMELFEKLAAKFDEHSAAAAVARMNELGLLDDESFARRKAAALKERNKSRREAARQLAEKGLEKDLIETVLEEVYREGDEEESLLALIEKQYARKLEQGKRDTVWAALCRRGFAPGRVRAALERWQRKNAAEWEETGWEDP